MLKKHNSKLKKSIAYQELTCKRKQIEKTFKKILFYKQTKKLAILHKKNQIFPEKQ